MAVKAPIEGAVEAAMTFLEFLKHRGVRTFKGDVLAPDGTKLWTVDVTFERETKRGTRETE